MIKKATLFLTIILTAFVGGYSQNDSLNYIDKTLNLRGVYILYEGLPLMVMGTCYTMENLDFRGVKYDYMPNFSTDVDDYLQFSPLVLTYAMKSLGFESRSSWGDLLKTTTLSHVIGLGVSQAMKISIDHLRPDGHGHNSFPSGHTTMAFMGAHILAKEYGEKYCLIPFLAYTSASLTGAMRVMNERHWLGDVCFGAGLGVFSVEMGYFLNDILFSKNKQSNSLIINNRALSNQNQFLIGLTPTYNICLNDKFKNGAALGIDAAYFYHKNFGSGLTADYSSYEIANTIDNQDSMLSLYHIGLREYFSVPLGHRACINAVLGLGLQHNLSHQFPVYNIDNQYSFRGDLGINLCLAITKNTTLRFNADFTHSKLKINNQETNFQTINLGSAVGWSF